MLWVTSLWDEVANCFKKYLKEMRKLREKLNFGIPGLCLDGKISIQLAFTWRWSSTCARDAYRPSKEELTQRPDRKITAMRWIPTGTSWKRRLHSRVNQRRSSTIVLCKVTLKTNVHDTPPLFNNFGFFGDGMFDVFNTNRYALTCWFYTRDEKCCK